MELDELEALMTAAALIGLLARDHASVTTDAADSALLVGRYVATALKHNQANRGEPK